METYVVMHEWIGKDTDKVNSTVQSIIAMSREGKIPKGLSLLGVMVSTKEPRAICVWESEKKEGIEQFIKSMNPPTKHSISEYTALYGLSRV
jgi:hypothetical protein